MLGPLQSVMYKNAQWLLHVIYSTVKNPDDPVDTCVLCGTDVITLVWFLIDFIISGEKNANQTNAE